MLASVVVVVASFALLGRELAPTVSPSPVAADAARIASLTTSIPPAVFDAVGAGGLSDPLMPTHATALTANGRPVIVYVGADFCPFCASERWSVVVALSRFGSFQDLGLTRSSSTDVYPNTATFSFRGASYASDVLQLVAVETADRDGKPFQPAPALPPSMSRFDPAGSIPFVSIADLYAQSGSGYRPDVLAGKTWQEIATALGDERSPIARAVIGNANYLTAAVCEITGGAPAGVCRSSAVKGLQRRT